MFQKISIIIGILLFGCLLAFGLGVYRYKQGRETAYRECQSIKQRLNSKIDVGAERKRLESMDLDVDYSPQSGDGNGSLVISSSRLDHSQTSCKVKIESGVIQQVQ